MNENEFFACLLLVREQQHVVVCILLTYKLDELKALCSILHTFGNEQEADAQDSAGFVGTQNQYKYYPDQPALLRESVVHWKRQVSWLVTFIPSFPSRLSRDSGYVRYKLVVTYSCATARELHTIPY